MNHNKKILVGLDHSIYEHPFDKRALAALEGTPGLNLVGKFITKHMVERVYTIQYTGSNLRITNENYPKIYEYLLYACQILDVKNIPDLYIQWGYNINAFTVGAENPIVVLDSGLIDLCDDDEIMFIIGHELGHIKSNHMLYHMMAQVINYIIDSIPLGNLAAAPIQYMLYYWNRMSEFTADRAGLLCCQDKDAAIRAFMKMAGMPIKEFNRMNYETFINQASEFKQLDYEAMNKVIKFLSIADESHPWTVMRAAELLNWMNSGDFQRLIDLGRKPILISPIEQPDDSQKKSPITIKSKPHLTIKESLTPKPLLTIKEESRSNISEHQSSLSHEGTTNDLSCIIIREIDNDNDVELKNVNLNALTASGIIQLLIDDHILHTSEDFEYYVEDKFNRRVDNEDLRSLSVLGYITGDVVRIGKSIKNQNFISNIVLRNEKTGSEIPIHIDLLKLTGHDLISKLISDGSLDPISELPKCIDGRPLLYCLQDKNGEWLKPDDMRKLSEMGFVAGDVISLTYLPIDV